jgi:hypothetical protein
VATFPVGAEPVAILPAGTRVAATLADGTRAAATFAAFTLPADPLRDAKSAFFAAARLLISDFFLTLIFFSASFDFSFYPQTFSTKALWMPNVPGVRIRVSLLF